MTMEELQNCDVEEGGKLRDLYVKESQIVPQRFLGVLGYDKRKNDLVYCKPYSPFENPDEIALSADSNILPSQKERPKVLVYFGGDIQVSDGLFFLGTYNL